MSDFRLRFSPAPTGFMHVGNVRTALFNWLYAASHRRHLHPPYRGHRRRPLHARGRRADPTRDAVARDSNGTRGRSCRAIASMHTSRRRSVSSTRAMRTSASAPRTKCASATSRRRAKGDLRATTAAAATSLPNSAPRSRPKAGRDRFASALPTRAAAFSPTSIRGEVSVEWSTISDFVIVRSNGTPVFFLANARRRHRHGDHARAAGRRSHRLDPPCARAAACLGHDDQPVYAHMPLILGPGGAKLSKRHGAISVEEYRDAGLSAERAGQLPRAARLGPRGRPRSADDRRVDRRVRRRAA